MDARPRHDRVVVIKHAFLPEDFEVDLLQLSLIVIVVVVVVVVVGAASTAPLPPIDTI